MAAADQAEHDLALLALDRRQRRVKGLAPGVVQPAPVVLGGACGQARLLTVQLNVLQRAMQLVPLDLVGDKGGHEVVDVGVRRDQDGQGRAAVLVPAAPAGGRFKRLPREDVRAEHRLEALRALAHDHVTAAADRLRQTSHRIKQRAHVGLRLGRQWMEDRAHAEVGLHQRLDLDLAGALQHGRVGAHVQLDRMPAGPPCLGGRFHRPEYERGTRKVPEDPVYKMLTSG